MMTKKAATKAFLAGYFSKVAEEGRVKKAQAVQGVSRPGPFRRGVSAVGKGMTEGAKSVGHTALGVRNPIFDTSSGDLRTPTPDHTWLINKAQAMHLNPQDFNSYTNRVGDYHRDIQGVLGTINDANIFRSTPGTPAPHNKFLETVAPTAFYIDRLANRGAYPEGLPGYMPSIPEAADYGVAGSGISTNILQVPPALYNRFRDLQHGEVRGWRDAIRSAGRVSPGKQ